MKCVWIILAGFVVGLSSLCSWGQAAREKVIIDTDIGDDVDDAFALALAVKSPELQILGITTTFGDTERAGQDRGPVPGRGRASGYSGDGGQGARRRLRCRSGCTAKSGHFAKSSHGGRGGFSAASRLEISGRDHADCHWAADECGGSDRSRMRPTFRKLKRVVIMGGSVRRGYGDYGYNEPVPPMPEWNILNDVASAQKLFASGVPLYVMPLDSTQLKLDEVKRAFLFTRGTAVTDQLAILYHLWAQETPTLFDPMTVAFALKPELCPVTALHIRVDEKGFTREEPGTPNAQVCLNSNPEDFFQFYLRRVAEKSEVRSKAEVEIRPTSQTR